VIHLSPANIFDEVDYLPIYLERSKSHPLDIHMSCFWAPDLTEQVMGLLLPHSRRWRQLSITTMNEHILSFFQRLQVPFLKAFTVSHYSNLRHAALPSSIFDNSLPRLDFLCLRNVNIDNLEFPLHTVKTLEIRGHGTWPSFARLNEMFGGLITLRHLILHVKPAEVLQQVRASSDATGTLSIGQILLPEVALIEVYTSEWLTADIAELLQLFACPKLQRLTMRESVSSTTEKVNMIMDFAVLKQGVKCSPVPKLMADPSDEEDRSTAWDDVEPCRKLWLQSANIYHACRVMSVSSASIITTLELHKVFFPRLSLMKEMFATLKSLVNLLILDFDSNSAMASITGLGPSQLDNIEWVSTQGTVIVPNLQRLLIDFNSSVSCFSSLEEPMEGDNNDRTKDFLQLFHLPSLSSLTLKDASLDQMRGVAEVFSQHHLEREDAYPKLAALKIVNMTEPLPWTPSSLDMLTWSSHSRGWRSYPCKAFTRTRWLGVSSSIHFTLRQSPHFHLPGQGSTLYQSPMTPMQASPSSTVR